MLGRRDYRYVGIPDSVAVTGDIMPLRETRREGPCALRAEDIAFLAEGVAERLSCVLFGGVVGDGAQDWFPLSDFSQGIRQMPSFISGDRAYLGSALTSGPTLDPDTRVLPYIVSGLCNTQWFPDPLDGPFISIGTPYMYVHPDKALTGLNKREIRNFIPWDMGSTWLRVMYTAGLPSLYPRNSVLWDFMSERERWDLNPKTMRKAFADLKDLQYVIFPLGPNRTRKCVHVSTYRGYDLQRPDEEIYSSAYDKSFDIAPSMYLQGKDLSEIGCYCEVADWSNSDDAITTSTIYMSEKGCVDSGYPWEDSDSRGTVCCVSSVDIQCNEAIPMDTGGLNMDLIGPGDMVNVYVVYRVWHRLTGSDGDGREAVILDRQYVVSSRLNPGFAIPKGLVRRSSCMEILADCGYPTEITSHPYPYHTEACGVDLVAAFFVARPRFRTDLSGVECPVD